MTRDTTLPMRRGGFGQDASRPPRTWIYDMYTVQVVSIRQLGLRTRIPGFRNKRLAISDPLCRAGRFGRISAFGCLTTVSASPSVMACSGRRAALALVQSLLTTQTGVPYWTRFRPLNESASFAVVPGNQRHFPLEIGFGQGSPSGEPLDVAISKGSSLGLQGGDALACSLSCCAAIFLNLALDRDAAKKLTGRRYTGRRISVGTSPPSVAHPVGQYGIRTHTHH